MEERNQLFLMSIITTTIIIIFYCYYYNYYQIATFTLPIAFDSIANILVELAKQVLL